MKVYFQLFLFAFFIGNLAAQDLDRYVVASAGDHFQSGTLTLDWTLGETAIESYTNSNGFSLSQGFHIGSISTVGTYEPITDLQVETFPNPTTEIVYVSSTTDKRLRVTVLDPLGRTLSVQDIEYPALKTSINLRGLPPATYFLLISDKSSAAQSIVSIVKM